MDDVKDKMKGLMKKVNNPFSSSSSGKFKGPARVLGSSSPSQSNYNPPNVSRLSSQPHTKSKPNPNPASKVIQTQTKSNPLVDNINNNNNNSSETERKAENGFDPFDSLITSGKRNPNGYSLKGFECPVCSRVFTSEEEVSEHIDSCLGTATTNSVSVAEGSQLEEGVLSRLQACVGAYVSAKPSDGSKEVVVRLLRNVVKEPDNGKFRKVRIGNPKIKEAIGDVPGGIELLECIGFELVEESGEMWFVMGLPSEEQMGLVKDALLLLEPKKVVEELPPAAVAQAKAKEPVEPEKVDRQIRVFFSVPENVAARIELPDSFYSLTAEEVKREADMRRKKLEESKLLIPKSYREKQAQAARRRYKRTIIRIQFPDGVVLQAVFSPLELTGALYELVSSALKDPSLEFELLHPVLVKRRVLPHPPGVPLEAEDLVPSALIKFRPIETGDNVFTGLCNELLEISEPLV